MLPSYCDEKTQSKKKLSKTGSFIIPNFNDSIFPFKPTYTHLCDDKCYLRLGGGEYFVGVEVEEGCLHISVEEYVQVGDGVGICIEVGGEGGSI